MLLSCSSSSSSRTLLSSIKSRARLLLLRRRGTAAVAAAAMSSGAAGAGADSNIVRDAAEIRRIALEAKRVAVLGIKPESKADQPAHYVAAYLAEQPGVEVIPVPTYFPEVTTILGRQVYRKLADIPPGPPVDIVDVFRKPSDLAGHLDDILALKPKPKCVWLQSGITDAAFEAAVAAAGIRVVADRCLLVEHRAAAQGARL